jgi:MazG family protein
MQKLIEIMERLRDPTSGCPWDREQTFGSISRYTIEEAYEVADAIQRDAMDELKDELGDLLFQVAFYTQVAKEQSLFDFADVLDSICAKMIRRHPHVFANEKIDTADQQTEAWEKHKAEERNRKQTSEFSGQLDGVAQALPALMRSTKLQKRAADVGFDWPDIQGPIEKIREELEEVQAEISSADSHARLEAEIGDLLFSCVNLARHAKVDAESALRRANQTFETRYRAMESMLRAKDRKMQDLELDDMEELWQQAKMGQAGK